MVPTWSQHGPNMVPLTCSCGRVKVGGERLMMMLGAVKTTITTNPTV